MTSFYNKMIVSLLELSKFMACLRKSNYIHSKSPGRVPINKKKLFEYTLATRLCLSVQCIHFHSYDKCARRISGNTSVRHRSFKPYVNFSLRLFFNRVRYINKMIHKPWAISFSWTIWWYKVSSLGYPYGPSMPPE